MLINNKIESYNYLRKNNFNHIDSTKIFHVKIFNFNKQQLINDFIKKHAYVSVREIPKEKGGKSIFTHHIPNHHVESVLYNKYPDKNVQLVQSLKLKDENHLIMNGEILISKNCKLNATLSSDKTSMRSTMVNPEYKLVNADLINEYKKQFMTQGRIRKIDPKKFISLVVRQKNGERYLINDLLRNRNRQFLPYFEKIIDFYVKHNLIGNIMKFSYYDVPVGVKKENLLIWEIRNY